MRKMLIALSVALMATTVADAEHALTGKWQEITPSGLQIELDLVATDTTVTGTFTVKGRTLTIMDGVVSKDRFTFKAKLDDQPEGFTGEMAGDEITLSRDRNGRVDAVTLKRVQPGLTGTWQGTTPNGFDLILDLAAKDTMLTGTFNRDGQSTRISDGKVSKNAFTFKLALDDKPEAFTGELVGDEIKLWMDRVGPARPVVLKRVKK
jgi:opacity protein-like surface antigen